MGLVGTDVLELVDEHLVLAHVQLVLLLGGCFGLHGFSVLDPSVLVPFQRRSQLSSPLVDVLVALYLGELFGLLPIEVGIHLHFGHYALSGLFGILFHVILLGFLVYLSLGVDPLLERVREFLVVVVKLEIGLLLVFEQ